MKRAVITGLGIVSCLGNDRTSVKDSLINGNSGIKYREDFNEMGLKCQWRSYRYKSSRSH